MPRIKSGPFFDIGYEAMATLADQSLTEREAALKAERLLRGRKPQSQAFAVVMGLKFRDIKREDYFERDQLAIWAGEGGHEP